MWVHVLGSGAGGGIPQWNCACGNCARVRSDGRSTERRTEESIAISSDGERWYLLNSSPDIHLQIERFPPLWPRGQVRHSPIAAVLLTDAEIDHTAGLLSLRQADSLTIYATDFVFLALSEWSGILRVLAARGTVDRRVVRLGQEFALTTELQCAAFSVQSDKVIAWAPGPYRSDDAVVGYCITDVRTGRSLAYLPCFSRLNDEVMNLVGRSTVALVDGTCWSDDELGQVGATPRRARQMGHLPVGGADGSLEPFAALSDTRVIYTHLNNTNPLVMDDAPERRAVEARALEVAFDGMEIEV